MENTENEVEDVEETNVEPNENESTQEPKTDETSEPKEKESPEAKRARLQRELSRHDKKYPVQKTETTEQKSDDLDYGQKAFLIANGVKTSEEIGLVKEIMASTGKTLDAVMESKYFQAELKEMRDNAAAKEAIPNGNKRSQQSAKDSVDFWLAKGELPPAGDRELRTQVVNARLKAEQNKNIFTDNPVVK